MKDIEYSEIDKALQSIMREVSSLRWKISKMDESQKEIDDLKAQVAIARECLGPCAGKLLEELRYARKVVEGAKALDEFCDFSVFGGAAQDVYGELLADIKLYDHLVRGENK